MAGIVSGGRMISIIIRPSSLGLAGHGGGKRGAQLRHIREACFCDKNHIK